MAGVQAVSSIVNVEIKPKVNIASMGLLRINNEYNPKRI